MELDRTALAAPPTIATEDLRLEPLGRQHFAPMWAALANREVAKLTGTHTTFTEDAVRRHLQRAADSDERADWAIVRAADDVYVGEVVLNELDEPNRSMNLRIALIGADVFGHGYGTRATRAVVDFGLDLVGLHRISLGVYDFNPRAQHVYLRCGFLREGLHRDALLWDGEWHDEIVMAILSTDPRPWRRTDQALLTDDAVVTDHATVTDPGEVTVRS